jgi:glycosyltransferase involved in cell wall biosynthesis
VLAEPAVAADDITGWLIPPADARALQDRLAHALSMTMPSRADMGRRSRAHILRHFAVETMMLETLRVYDGLLGTGLAGRLVDGCRAVDSEDGVGRAP